MYSLLCSLSNIRGGGKYERYCGGDHRSVGEIIGESERVRDRERERGGEKERVRERQRDSEGEGVRGRKKGRKRERVIERDRKK